MRTKLAQAESNCTSFQ